MPMVAAAAGVGVASIYRQFPSKSDLLAALVIRRLEQIGAAAAQAIAAPGDRWTAFTGLLRAVVAGQSADDFLSDAFRQVSDHADVIAEQRLAAAQINALMAQAQDEGRLRADATAEDVWLVFAATKAARLARADAFLRMLELLIDGLEARP